VSIPEGKKFFSAAPQLQVCAKHLINWDWSVLKCSDTKCSFLNIIFLILVVRNKRSSIDRRTRNWLSSVVYI